MKKKWKVLLAVMLMFTMIFSSCAVAESVGVAEPAEDALVCTVNGMPIYASTIDEEVDYLVAYFSEEGYDMTLEENLTYARAIALDTTIDRAVMLTKAVELGLDQSSNEEMEQIKEQNHADWMEMVDYYVQNMMGLTADNSEDEWTAGRLQMLALLESAGYTEEGMLASTLENAVYSRVEDVVTKDVVVDDALVDAYFQSLVDESKAQFEGNAAMYEFMTMYYGSESYYVPEGFRGVTQILLNVDEELMNAYTDLTARLEEKTEGVESGDATASDMENAVTQADVDAAYAAIIASVQPTVDEIMEKYHNGTPFADLIAEYGNDPGMTQEPEKTEGYSVHMDSIMWDPAFVKAAFSVNNVGDVSEPVVGSYGVYIVQYVRDVPSGAVEFTPEMRAAFTAQLLGEAKSIKMSEQLAAWTDEAVITYTEAAADYQLPEGMEE